MLPVFCLHSLVTAERSRTHGRDEGWPVTTCGTQTAPCAAASMGALRHFLGSARYSSPTEYAFSIEHESVCQPLPEAFADSREVLERCPNRLYLSVTTGGLPTRADSHSTSRGIDSSSLAACAGTIWPLPYIYLFSTVLGTKFFYSQHFSQYFFFIDCVAHCIALRKRS